MYSIVVISNDAFQHSPKRLASSVVFMKYLGQYLLKITLQSLLRYKMVSLKSHKFISSVVAYIICLVVYNCPSRASGASYITSGAPYRPG